MKLTYSSVANKFINLGQIQKIELFFLSILKVHFLSFGPLKVDNEAQSVRLTFIPSVRQGLGFRQ